MEEKKLAVIALGGNAILRGNQKGTVEEQNQNIRETLENLIYLVREGYNLIITHGNGPQVGNILMSDDAGVKMYGLPPMTLDMCVAYSQGEIGYMIEILIFLNFSFAACSVYCPASLSMHNK